MLTNQELKDTILALRAGNHTIGSISALTGATITTVCEVIYDQDQKDKFNDSLPVVCISRSQQY